MNAMITFSKEKTFFLIAGLFILLDLLFLRWVVIHFPNWGIWDWDYQLTLLEASRKSLLHHHQLPLWNPFIKGGVTLAGNTLNHVWGPSFIPILLFGSVAGVKVCIFLYLLIAQCGMFLLAQQHRIAKEGAFLAAILYTLGGVYAHRLTHGHFEWIAIAWIPFIVLMIHNAFKRFNKKTICAGGVFLAFLFLDGGPYQFAFLSVFLAFYTIFLMVKCKSLKPLTAVILIFVIGMSLSSIKLFPMYERVKKFPRVGGEINFYGLSAPPKADKMMYQMFLSRNQRHRSNTWMPYILNVGCYVGWIPLILACAAVLTRPRKHLPLVATTLFIGWIMLGDSAPLNLWGILHTLPGFSLLRIPSRFNVFVLFALSLLAGEGLAMLKVKVNNNRWLHSIPLLIVVVVAMDLLWVNGKVFRVAFSVPPITVEPEGQLKHYEKSPYLTHYREGTLYEVFHNVRSAAFPAVLENRGVRDTLSTINRETEVLPFTHPQYRGEVWFDGEEGKITHTTITPNRITVETDGLVKTLVINQNYDDGWNVRGTSTAKVISRNGLLAVEIPAGQRTIELSYLPHPFLWGTGVTLATLLIILVLLFVPHPPKSIHEP